MKKPAKKTKKTKATKMNMAQAFDEWMRRYKENPEQFGNDMSEAAAHSRKKRSVEASDYGNNCAAYLSALMAKGKAAML